ncbi:MAG: UvrD-helicase domain-containing protein [Candidatus Enteromonas sp.]|nr:UvrD-helicase domain-containing protein [Candidatus Enteromonas sp.]
MGLFTKNEAREYKALEDFSQFIERLLLEDEFLSRKVFAARRDEQQPVFDDLSLMEEKGVLVDWCKRNKVDYKKMRKLMSDFSSVEQRVQKHNESYVARHLVEERDYLDHVLEKDDPNIKLDEEQRRVVLSDEDYTLVIAGAGAGKTTTIEAKVKYLVDKKNVEPERVLIVSFTRKATQELKERFARLDIPVHIATFHSIGNAIIKDSDAQRRKIVEQGFMYKVIEEYLTSKLEDEWFIKKVLLFFASYLNMPFEAENAIMLFKTLSANDNITMKSILTAALDEYHKDQTRKKVTLNDERVRSAEECRIANWLFIHGIDYEYEPVYPYSFAETTKPYCPDFLIHHNGQDIYLEHFGLSEDGTNNRFSDEQLSAYKKHVNDKIKLHRRHGTKLIYTFSKYRDGRDLITHLEETLKKAGVEGTTKSDVDIYRKLAANAQDKYFHKLILLVCNFIHRFKVCNYDINTKFDEWQFGTKSERTKLFLEIAKQCFHIYEARRMEERAIDFEDMINDAANVLDQRIASRDYLPYDYILVDEYQDISLQRFDLCQKLAQASHAKIIAVGDDWQSIFRFSGAQIDLFTKFSEKMGYANVLQITRTYRNSQELIDIAGGFVMANQKQIKKDLKSGKSIKDPVILMSYDDSYEKDDQQRGPFYRMGEAIMKALDDIVSQCGEDKTVLLIGRYNFDGKNLTKLEDFFSWERNRLVCKKYPKLDISFMTAHASKGLGRDNVIIINGKDDILGFPSKIEDDPVMKLVIKDDETMDFEEERRLFYVALTRTKNRVYIVTPQNRPSKFITEIKDKFTSVTLRGVELTPREGEGGKHVCPVCGYPLQYRETKLKIKATIKKLWICSNDPEVCGFITNDLNGNPFRFSISKCPDCHDGYLVVKPIKNREGGKGDRMLGCTNYKPDGTGCNFTMFPDNYTQDKSKILVDENGRARTSETKGDVVKIVSSIASIYRKTKYRFSYMTLIRFLMGEEDKAISAFRLSEEESYGLLRGKKSGYAHAIVKALIDLDVLQRVKNDRGFEILELSQDDISDGQISVIEGYLKRNK